MSYASGQDPLCYPGSNVLRNKLGLRDQEALDEFEVAMFQERVAEPLPTGSLDYPHYRAIHRHLFQDVYDWAGELRTIRIAKGGNWFCYPENLDGHMTATFGWLADRSHLAGIDGPAFAPFNDDALEPDRTLAAMIASFSGDLVPLEALIADIIA